MPRSDAGVALEVSLLLGAIGPWLYGIWKILEGLLCDGALWRNPTEIGIVALARRLGPGAVYTGLRMMLDKREAELKPVGCYDVVVASDSVRTLNSHEADGGCKVICHTEVGKQVFSDSLKLRRVGVVGQYNAGKTWLLQHLFGFRFPQGKLQRTKGLSMKLDESKNLLIIDSAGNLEPISSESTEDVADAVHDRKDVEVMNKELLVEASDLVILVVNELTWPEQESTQALANRCNRVRRGEHKVLIVVHNMSEVREAEEAKKMFHEQIARCYKGAEVRHVSETRDVLEFVDVSDDSGSRTRHYGVANEFSPAGQFYNRGAFQEILRMIDMHFPDGRMHCIKQVIEASSISLLPQFFYTESDPCTDGAMQGRHSGSMRLKFYPTEHGDRNDSGVLGVVRIAELEKRKIYPRRRGVFTPLGDINTLDLVWEPPVMITIEKCPDGMCVKHITIEAPGCTEEHVQIDSQDSGVQVIVHKPLVNTSIEIETPEDSRRFGTWKRLFEYVDARSDAQYEWWDEGFSVSDGVIHIKLKKRQLNRSIKKATVLPRTPSGTASEASSRVPPPGALPGPGDEAATQRSNSEGHMQDEAPASMSRLLDGETVASFTLASNEGSVRGLA